MLCEERQRFDEIIGGNLSLRTTLGLGLAC